MFEKSKIRWNFAEIETSDKFDPAECRCIHSNNYLIACLQTLLDAVLT